jgi:hypothetical protein
MQVSYDPWISTLPECRRAEGRRAVFMVEQSGEAVSEAPGVQRQEFDYLIYRDRK